MIAEATHYARRIARTTTQTEASDVLKGAAAGLVGGLVASLVMDGVQMLMSLFTGGGDGAQGGETPAYTPEAQRIRGVPAGDTHHMQDEGEQPTEKAATAVAESVGVHLSKKQRKVGGAAVHLGFGASVGAVYGALAEITPAVTVGMGAPYGLAVWLLADETALSLLGLDDPPQKRPIKSHASMFALHLVYGLALESTRKVLRDVI